MKLYILHGWGQSSKHWKIVKEKLANFVEIELLDMPSVNPKLSGGEDWGIPDFSNWLDQQLKGQKDVLLLGHSFGGRVSSYYAAKHKHNLKGLVLYGSPSIYRPSPSTQMKTLLANKLGGFIPTFFKSKMMSAEYLEAKKNGRGGLFKRAVKFDQTDLLD